MISNNEIKRQGIRRHAISAATLALFAGFCTSVSAFDIDTGNDDVKMRLDDTVRYNFGKRVEGQNQAILKNPNFDDGDRNFKNGSTVTDRVDLLTEFDVVYQKKYGFRVSAASWYDAAYSGGFSNTSVGTSNHFENGVQSLGLSNYAKRYYEGPSGEILDAFAFGTFDLGNMPLTVRAGKHSVTWGESLLLGGAISGVTYGQSPLDAGKGFSTPGIDAKELFLPLTQLSGQLQATPELSLAGQYYFRWASTRVMEDGTYLGPADNYFLGGESLILGPGLFAKHRPDITPKNSGDWGVSARWNPEWLDGTMGFYYRNFTDKLPQTVIQTSLTHFPKPLPPVLPTGYFLTYGSNIDLFGISLAKQVAGISFGAELNYRKNMPLQSSAVTLAPGAALPAQGQLLGARGDTAHGVLNMLTSIPATPLWNSAVFAAELSWDHWVSVTSDPFHSFIGYDSYKDVNKVSRNAFGLAMNFTPTWYQVFPSADLSMPISYSRGLSGNSAVQFGSSKDAGNYAIGLGLDLYSKYRFDLKYVGFFGNFSTAANGAAKTPIGLTSLLQDRGAVYFTFKTTF